MSRWWASLVCYLSLAEGLSIETRFSRQLASLTSLYPPAELSLRNAASRTDGYWPFVGRKEEPPIGLTYGEFPLPFFSQLTDRACELAGLGESRADATFCDIGSGSGRLVIWASATHEWKAALGVEILTSLCKAADEKLEQARAEGLELLTSDVQLYEGSWDDASLLDWGSIDIAFAYTTAFPADEDNVLAELTAALTPRLRRGCLVCTTDYTLGDGFELLESIEGANDGVGGMSVGYVHRKTCDGASAAEVALEGRLEALDAEAASLRDELAERAERVGELESALEARDAEVSELQEEVARLEAALEEAERGMLTSLQAWADANDYGEGGSEGAAAAGE